MIINGRPVADGSGTADLQRLAARRGEELGPSNGFTNLAFGMMSEQEWQTYKDTASAGAAKSAADAQAGEASWDAWAREHAVLAWLSAPDAAQRAVPAETLAQVPVDETAIEVPATDAAPGYASIADAVADDADAARGYANLQQFQTRSQELIAQGTDGVAASLRAQLENQLGALAGTAVASASSQGASATQQFFDDLAIARQLAGAAGRDIA